MWIGRGTGVVTARLALAVGAVAVAPASVEAQAVVTFLSGPAIRGQLKRLSRNNLELDTREMRIVLVKWEEIAQVVSPEPFEVTTASGNVYFGRLAPADQARVLAVQNEGGTTDIPFAEVVEIVPVSDNFLARTSGYLDVGMNLARANQLASFLVRARVAYRTLGWGASVEGEAYGQTQQSTTQAGETSTQTTDRGSIDFGVNRFLSGRFALRASEKLERNSELNLEERALTTLGAEYLLVRNQAMELGVGVGGVLNSERYGGQDRAESGEANVFGRFDAYDTGALKLYTMVNSYTRPDTGRFRLDVDGRISWEVITDFFIGFNVTEKWDTKPPPGSPDRDFQYGVTIGWSWS